MFFDQETMEKAVRAAVDEVYELQAGKVNALLEPKYIDCNVSEKTATIGFPVLKWEMNRVNVMHGGAISACFDFTLGILTRFYAQLHFSPTVNLETTYLKAIPFGDELQITGRVVSAGRSLTHLYAEAHLKSSGKLVATAKSTYLNVDTKKEPAK